MEQNLIKYILPATVPALPQKRRIELLLSMDVRRGGGGVELPFRVMNILDVADIVQP